MAWMIFWVRGMSGQCLQDPLSFYAEKMDQDQMCKKNYHYEITCSPNNLSNIMIELGENVSTTLLSNTP